MDANQSFFRVTYVAPSGFKYVLTCKAPSKADAVRFADETLEYVERIGISDHLREDGMTVEAPAQLEVERIQPEEATPGSGIVITTPDGTVKRK